VAYSQPEQKALLISVSQPVPPLRYVFGFVHPDIENASGYRRGASGGEDTVDVGKEGTAHAARKPQGTIAQCIQFGSHIGNLARIAEPQFHCPDTNPPKPGADSGWLDSHLRVLALFSFNKLAGKKPAASSLMSQSLR